ncbi:LysR family transcriptional regulator [Affinibrenneria salicis]|uniref:LysR family transcriptional regulator n=1 Tax=Affinibrenneria salicis TaxID=2590031 RepID=A0A5J5FV09_9GAMM|nr:LysR substrate-binding domain-containing protein [Affinibrenneria salicis]KAA8997375.1 LysR family transcriptional regulator [Affinibrenneria salicis]
MEDRIPSLYALRAFEVAARTQSFTQAAAQLSITQSAVSRHVKTLEQHLGCRLFERHGPRLRLTDAGRALAQELLRGFNIVADACGRLRRQQAAVRIKAPSTLTMRWLLAALERFNVAHREIAVQLSSVWMDMDTVDFYAEPYDCAILLGNGRFGGGIRSVRLFDEWLVPICAPGKYQSQLSLEQNIRRLGLIHPSADRRDWARWLERVGLSGVDLQQGKVFDSLEQGINAALLGYGLSIGDLVLTLQAIERGELAVPIDQAVQTGDGYYFVWPEQSVKGARIDALRDFLRRQVPALAERLSMMPGVIN